MVTVYLCFDSNRNCIFNEKIGLFLFVYYEKAKWNSKNQMKGTFEMKPLNITYSVYLRYLCTKVLPAIKINGLIKISTFSFNKTMHPLTFHLIIGAFVIKPK